MPVNDTRPLFARLLGESFESLPSLIRRVHDGHSCETFRGSCEIKNGNGPFSRLLARAAGLPPPGNNVPVSVLIERNANQETWTRNFGGAKMRSSLSEEDGLLFERIGLVCLAFRLTAEKTEIVWTAAGGRVMGIALPAAWFMGVTARESSNDGRYTFDVRADLPGLGLLIHYQGWLEPDD